jgi:regulator of protease activity HflC (stomatin/prohibitin superfamily)
MKKPERNEYDSSWQYERAVEQYRKHMEMKTMVKAGLGIGGAVIVGLVALTVLGGSWYTVDQGERGVMLRNGAITGVSEPGLGFKMPIVDRVVDIDVRSRAQIYENVLAYSRDQQVAGLTLSVNYRVPADAVVSVYENYGSVEQLRSRLLDRQIMDESKNVFGRFNAATAIQDRSRLVAEIQDAVQAAVLGPIIIESVQIENIDFSDAYEQSIEQRMLAEVEVERVRQNAERERVQAEIAVIQAQAAADARVAQATAEAEAIRMQGNAEADAIQARGDALRENPELINLVQAERWNGQLPTTMLPNTTVPFMNMN